MRAVRASSAVALVLLVFAVGASGAGAVNQLPWQLPAIDLSAPGQSASDPQIAATADGSSTAVWNRSNGSNSIVQASTRPPGGFFGAVVDLSVPGKSAFNPQVTTAPDGSATAVWRRSDGGNSIIQASTRPPDGTFGAPVDLSAAGEDAFEPQIAISRDGSAFAVWYRYDGTKYIVQASTRPPNGSFGPPVDLSAIGQSASAPQITAAPDGGAIAVWTRSNGSNSIIQASIRPPRGSFGPSVDLSAAGQSASAPQIATATDGSATAVWYRYDGSNIIVQASTKPPGGSFGPPVDLSAVGQDAAAAQIAAAPDGSATVIWNRFDGNFVVIQASTRPPGGNFGLPVDVSATGQNANRPQISVSPDGTATAVWYRYNGSNFIIQSSTRPPGGAFAAAVDLSATGNGASMPEVATSPDGAGVATAVWLRFNGTHNVIQAASTGLPQLLLGVTRIGSGEGTVTSSPTGILCGIGCATTYLAYTNVALTATPDKGSKFTGWGGDCKGTGPCQVKMNDAKTVTATFRKAARFPKVSLIPKKKKLKAGKKVRFTVKVTNSGGLSGRAKVKIKASDKHKLRVPGKVTLLVPAGKTAKKSFTAKSKNAQRGKVKVTAKLGGKVARSVITLK